MNYKNNLNQYSNNNSELITNQNIFYSMEADTNLSLFRMERSGLISTNSIDTRR